MPEVAQWLAMGGDYAMYAVAVMMWRMDRSIITIKTEMVSLKKWVGRIDDKVEK